MVEPGLEQCKETPALLVSSATVLLGKHPPSFARVVL